MVAADGSDSYLVDAQASTAVWVGSDQIVYNQTSSSHIRLYDLASRESFPLVLPVGSYVVDFTDPEEAATGMEGIPVTETEVLYAQTLQNVNIHAGPGEAYEVIGSIFDGQTAQVTGMSEDGLWWCVICPDDTIGSCWVSAAPEYTLPVGSGAALLSP